MPNDCTSTPEEPREAFDLDDAQSNLDDALTAARAVVTALECAESCETVKDFFANLEDAKDQAVEAMKQIAHFKE